MTERKVYNFSAGPATLPVSVLNKAHAEFLDYQNSGMSVMEMSHRSKYYEGIIAGAEAAIRKALNVPNNYKVLFLQGGASLQFTMIPMNFLRNSGKKAGFITTGSWGQKAFKQAKLEGETAVLWDGASEKFTRTPKDSELADSSNLAYVHYTSNETIEGVQFKAEPNVKSDLICDSSSDFMCRPLDVSKYAMIYAGAQKNAGPAGTTIVILREDLLTRIPEKLHVMLDYKTHVENGSMYNTPPCYTIYMVKLVAEWLNGEIGGLDKMEKLNNDKAGLLYNVIDESSGFYKGHAAQENRSTMNVTWRLPSEDLEKKFIDEAKALNMIDLKGHRSVGGLRASIYNAMPREGVEKLALFMNEFRKKN
ncbi:3-phosphoserine/phosphohydroxythreonine transaminase [bacterium]|nr:3-phosphoserine/phosphohydroxythreonine transaminase [bacterium]